MKWTYRWCLGLLALAIVAGPFLLPNHRLRALFERGPSVRLVVDLSKRQLVVLRNGDVVTTYGIAIGRPGHPTPTGTFRTGDIVYNPRWRPPPQYWARNLEPQPGGSPNNPMQGVKIFFREPYYFIHGTNDPGSIGEAASHGCIRMTADDAVTLARTIERAGGSVPLVIRP